MTGALIDVADLWTGEYHDRLPLAALDADENSHIHARLTIVVDGRELPRLGFFGPDDVCLNSWVPELLQIRLRLQAIEGRHVFEEAEQGQPAFAFERSGRMVLVSVLSSQLSGADGDGSWSKIACAADEFLVAIDRVLDRIREQVFALGLPGSQRFLGAGVGFGGSGESDGAEVAAASPPPSWSALRFRMR